MLSHLGFDNGIVIRQPHIAVGPVDFRVVGEILSGESVVQQLISYNEEQCHESFLHGLHACMICFSEYTGNLNAIVDAQVLFLGLISCTMLCIILSLLFSSEYIVFCT